MNTKRKIPKTEYENIRCLYKSGKTCDQIGELYNVSRTPVIRILKEIKEPIRSTRDAARKHYYNFDYFEKIDSRQKAYILGILYTDGNNYTKKNRVALGMNDIEVINFYNQQLGIKKQPYKIFNKKGNCHYRSDIYSKKISKDLLNLGVTPKKSKNLTFPYNQINKEFYKDFVLGCFDGDGWVCKTNKYYHIGFCGTKDMCLAIQKIIEDNTGVKLNLIKNNTIYSIRTQDKIKFAKTCSFLYDDCIFCMNRKKQIFNQFKKENAELFI